jgi:hypothetical protein
MRNFGSKLRVFNRLIVIYNEGPDYINEFFPPVFLISTT